MKIAKTSLISMLIPNPINDKEIGYNQSLIEILQGKCQPEVSNQGKRFEIYKNNLTGWQLFTKEQLNELDDTIVNGGKLAAVKFHKEITGVGLKESKDDMDAIFELVKQYK